MCGIYGYIGSKSAHEVITDGLKRLDYRGYDSWGVAVMNEKDIEVTKDVGLVKSIEETAAKHSHIGIGHTRWATHGAVTVLNAHPHLSTDKTFTLAQNGIVENFKELKDDLVKKGYKFESQTDTEVIVRLIEEEMKTLPNIHDAIIKTFRKLTGRNTIIVLTHKGEIIAARNGSPLVIGQNSKTSEMYVSSDTLSFAPYVDEILVMENMQIVYLTENKIKAHDMAKGTDFDPQFEKLDVKNSIVDKAGYEHYMLKEIHETPESISAILHSNTEKYLSLAGLLKTSRTVYTMGSGSAGVAAAQIAFYLRQNSKLNAISLIGAEAQEYFPLFTKDDVIIVPSQSGETADVLEVLEVIKKKGTHIVSYVNMPGSMITRMSEIGFLAEAGPEVCVMSTKVFTSQIAWGYYVSKYIMGNKDLGEKELITLTKTMKGYLEDKKNHDALIELAKMLKEKHDIFLLGKYQNFAVMHEGMIKLIEGTYKHAHALPAGDLKHYAITLIEQGVPVIAVYGDDIANSDIENAISQVKARGATVIGVGPIRHGNLDHFLRIPNTGETQAIMNIIPLQLLAYYLAKELGNSIDKPRNIAKSVTVK